MKKEMKTMTSSQIEGRDNSERRVQIGGQLGNSERKVSEEGKRWK